MQTPEGILSSRLVLVTGAHGFLGRHVARAIAGHGHTVFGLGHGAWSGEEYRSWGISEWHSADITAETLCARAGEPEWIFHCAGSGSVGFSIDHPNLDYQRSVTTTQTLLEFVRLVVPTARIVLPSSAGVYGLASRMPISVRDNLAPVSPYGRHKKMAEDLCRDYAGQFGIPIAIIRLFSLYGIGLRKQLLWDACTKIAAGDLLFSGTGEETRDWIHVEDAAELLIQAAASAASPPLIVNGGSGNAVCVRAMLGELSSAFGAGQTPRFTGIGRPGDPVDYQADISEALRLGWSPKRNLHEETRRYVEWFKGGAQ